MNLEIRGTDKWGSGAYGAGRSGGRKHDGVDIVAEVGAPVYALDDGVYERVARPYKDDARYVGLAVRAADGTLYKYFYVAPGLSIGAKIKKGDLIGQAQDIAARYPSITPHWHFEVRDARGQALDPAPWLEG